MVETHPFYVFWDKRNDEIELLCEDGQFYFYSEDSVAISRDHDQGRSWTRLEKLTDVTPLNEWDRFEIMDPANGEWVSYGEARVELIQAVQKHAGIIDWWDVV